MILGSGNEIYEEKRKRSENANSVDELATITQPSLEPTPEPTLKNKTVVVLVDSIVKNVQE